MNYYALTTERALSPTSITIADYVINPYTGCDFQCVYCYGRMNSSYQKKRAKYGHDFVEIKENFIELLREELKTKKPHHVLIGSITEVFQEAEQKHRITRAILQMLNERSISYTILTKSHHIVDEVATIAAQPKNEVYVTLNTFDEAIREHLEPAASPIAERCRAIEALTHAGIRVVIHVGPYLPGISDADALCAYAKKTGAGLIEFESLNLVMAGKTAFLNILQRYRPDTHAALQQIYRSNETYEQWSLQEQAAITQIAIAAQIPVKFFFYPYDSYYDNTITY